MGDRRHLVDRPVARRLSDEGPEDRAAESRSQVQIEPPENLTEPNAARSEPAPSYDEPQQADGDHESQQDAAYDQERNATNGGDALPPPDHADKAAGR
jgi:hypothetical protein